MSKKIVSLIEFLIIVAIIAGVASHVTMPAVEGWYHNINKPSWTPPDYVFGPVWTVLYILIAISGWLVWNKLPTESFWSRFSSLIMAPYWVQLLLNFLWSIVFFYYAQAVPAEVDIIMLAITIGLNIGTFIKVDRVAAFLLIPYLLWVLYASSLNLGIVLLN